MSEKSPRRAKPKGQPLAPELREKIKQRRLELHMSWDSFSRRLRVPKATLFEAMRGKKIIELTEYEIKKAAEKEGIAA